MFAHPLVINFSAKSDKWKESGIWTGKRESYQAQVIAKKNASLKQLAFFITGFKDDWLQIGNSTEKVPKGSLIDVAPLLVKLESRIREQVIKVEKNFNSRFPVGAAEIAAATDVPNRRKRNEAKEVDRYFSSSQYSFCDCNSAIRIIYSKAVKDVVGERIFNAVCYESGSVPLYSIEVPAIKDVKSGDWITFNNYYDYTDKMRELYVEKLKKANKPIPDPLPSEAEGAYQAENVLQISANQFWGHPQRTDFYLTEQEWLLELRNAYNKPDDVAEGKQRFDAVPGYNGIVIFIDVIEIAQAAFRFRAFEEAGDCKV